MKNTVRKDKKQILIMEAYTDANVGSASLIENAVKLCRKYFPDFELRILAQQRKHVEDFCKVDTYSEVFQLPVGKHRLRQMLWLISTVTWMILHYLILLLRLGIPPKIYTLNRERLKALEQIKDSKVCISIGAERMNDNFVLGMPFSLYSLWLIKKYGKKLILFPQTIGPFYRKISKHFSKKILEKCDFVFLRDKRSVEIMDSFGIDKNKYAFLPDIAILQEPIGIDERIIIWKKENIPFDKEKLSGISAMHWSYANAKGNYSDYDVYKRSIAKAVDYMIEKYDYRIVFVPTNVGVHGCREDDIKVAKEIMELIKRKDKTHSINNLYKPAELKGLIGDMDMFLATRMHSCIFSTGMFTPTFSINYQFKLYEYMKLHGLQDNTVDIEKVTFEKLKQLIDYTYENRKQIRKSLEQSVNNMKAHIYETMEKTFVRLINEH